MLRNDGLFKRLFLNPTCVLNNSETILQYEYVVWLPMRKNLHQKPNDVDMKVYNNEPKQNLTLDRHIKNIIWDHEYCKTTFS